MTEIKVFIFLVLASFSMTSNLNAQEISELDRAVGIRKFEYGNKSPTLDSLLENDKNLRGKAKFKVIIGYDGVAKSAEFIRSSFKSSYLDSLCRELLMNLEYVPPLSIEAGQSYFLKISISNRKRHRSIIISQPKSLKKEEEN